jgi:transposase
VGANIHVCNGQLDFRHVAANAFVASASSLPNYDITLGGSESALESYFLSLEGKEQVRVVCMDLAAVYRSIVKVQFPNTVIVADRFHVI